MNARQPRTVAGDRLLIALSMLLPGWTHYGTTIAEVEDEARHTAVAQAVDQVVALAAGHQTVPVAQVLVVLGRLLSLALVLFMWDPTLDVAA